MPAQERRGENNAGPVLLLVDDQSPCILETCHRGGCRKREFHLGPVPSALTEGKVPNRFAVPLPKYTLMAERSPAPKGGTNRGGPAPSSRESVNAAGWECGQPGQYLELMPKRVRAFHWLSPAPLWQSRNDKLARWFGDPTDEHRRAWMKARTAENPDLVVDHPTGDSSSFLLLGDTGEGDASQYAVVPPLLSQAKGDRLRLHLQRRHLPGRRD